MKTQFCNEESSCCGNSHSETDTKNTGHGIPECMKKGKWFMLIPATLLISAFLGTFLLHPELVRVIWLVVTGSILTLGLLFFVMMTFWMRSLKKEIN